MQYDFYFEKASYWQQFWYNTTLLLIVGSPLVILLTPLIQLAWPRGTAHQRVRLVAATVLVWLAILLLLIVANVPVIDYLID